MKKTTIMIALIFSVVTGLSAKEYPSSITTADKLVCKITHGGPKLSNKTGYDVRRLSDMSAWYINAELKDEGKTIKFNDEYTMKFKSDTIDGGMIYANSEASMELDDKRDGTDGEITFYNIHIFTNKSSYKNFGNCFLQ